MVVVVFCRYFQSAIAQEVRNLSLSNDTSEAAPEKTAPKTTPLYQSHVDAGAKLVDFAGWQMPVNYGSQISEHAACREQAVMFDVSHMTVVDLPDSGSGEVKEFLQKLLANDVAKAKLPGDAVYSCMLQDDGGIIDDLIAYRCGDHSYRLIVNAGTRDKDIDWIKKQLSANSVATELNVRDDLALLAVQGPKAIELATAAASAVCDASVADQLAALQQMKRFSSLAIGMPDNSEWFIARTGYTGEDGLEIALPGAQAPVFWKALIAAGVLPAGLGARDTLRLEAAMNLYGSDMDETVNPLESGISWTVAWQPEERDFIGRAALQASRNADGKSDRQMVGLLLEGRGVLRGHQQIQVAGTSVGEITSGTFSPTLQKSIALGRVSMQALGVKTPADIYALACEVIIRDKPVAARFVKAPFVAKGQPLY